MFKKSNYSEILFEIEYLVHPALNASAAKRINKVVTCVILSEARQAKTKQRQIIAL